MTQHHGEGAEPPSSLNLPEPPPAAPVPPTHLTPGNWSEPPAPGSHPGETSFGAPPAAGGIRAGYRLATMDPAQQRGWAAVAHFSALGALVIGLNFLGPLLVFLAFKDRGDFVRDQALESLNFQLTTCIAGFASLLLIPVFGLGILAFLVVFIGWLILSVIAGIAANNGQAFRYPVNLRLVK